MRSLIICHILFLLIGWAASHKILMILEICSKSHFSMYQRISDGLLSRGHEVTFISCFESHQNVQNYTAIKYGDAVQDFVDCVTIEESKLSTGYKNYITMAELIEPASCRLIYNLELIKELINKNKKVDLIISEVYHTQCFNLLAHVLDVPLVNVVPPSLSSGVDYFVGNPHNPSYIPLITSPYTTKMDFFQRLQNSIQYIFLYWYQTYIFNRDMKEIARQHCDLELPPDEVLNKRTTLVMYDNHFSYLNRPKSPNAVDVAGIHIKPANRLPKDLEDFIEESPNGVILFSFGTSIKASTIPDEIMKAIVHTFFTLPQRVLWRVDRLNFTEVSQNVKLVKWLPQRDILEHPNVIAFISHCGLYGTLEAIHTATPIIGIPIWFDEFHNANLLVEKGVGIYLDFNTINRDTFGSAIKEILSPKYSENMLRLSQIFKDRPMTPLDEALYWLEYVLKYQGASHLRTQAADMPLYQYLLLDVILFFAVSFSSILYMLYFFCKFVIIRFCCIKNKNKIE